MCNDFESDSVQNDFESDSVQKELLENVSSATWAHTLSLTRTLTIGIKQVSEDMAWLVENYKGMWLPKTF